MHATRDDLADLRLACELSACIRRGDSVSRRRSCPATSCHLARRLARVSGPQLVGSRKANRARDAFRQKRRCPSQARRCRNHMGICPSDTSLLEPRNLRRACIAVQGQPLARAVLETYCGLDGGLMTEQACCIAWRSLSRKKPHRPRKKSRARSEWATNVRIGVPSTSGLQSPEYFDLRQQVRFHKLRGHDGYRMLKGKTCVWLGSRLFHSGASNAASRCFALCLVDDFE